tara:strand:- start:3515 stop:6163 length:2649 start_codon:yes stop_codon:yes gene_type:complete
MLKIEVIEKNVKKVVSENRDINFIYNFLSCYDIAKASIKRLKNSLNLSSDKNEVFWKNKLFFRVEKNNDLHVAIDNIENKLSKSKYKPRFIIVTDFNNFLASDLINKDKLEVKYDNLWKHSDFFGFWSGYEKSKVENENQVDIKAAQAMALLYENLFLENSILFQDHKKDMNIFLCRLLFCYFAEDTNIFKENIFTGGIERFTVQDGSDLDTFFNNLFFSLSNDYEHKSQLNNYFKSYPNVGGGLFDKIIKIPKFSKKTREIIINSGKLDWKTINPDIFGSMMQATSSTESRKDLGKHYTEKENILKTIKPLFLNDLFDEFENNKDNEKKMMLLLNKIANIQIFDPACGSGNFLVIAFKELCYLEMKIIKHLNLLAFSEIKLENFYGLEIEDFSCEIANLSLWLAKFQMDKSFFDIFNRIEKTFPLKNGPNILCKNSCRFDWNLMCDNSEKITFVVGNPPFLGSKKQKSEHKLDMEFVFGKSAVKKYKSLDYVSCWFFIASKYLNQNTKISFVSTSSLFQGEQVPSLWKYILNDNVVIGYAYKPFPWTNKAKDKAGVTCVIVSLELKATSKNKYLFENNFSKKVCNISPYLIEGDNTVIDSSTHSISNFPKMKTGNQPIDGGHLILKDPIEVKSLKRKYPQLKNILKKFYGSREFIDKTDRWCLWIEEPSLVENIPEINDKLKSVKDFRLQSKRPDTKKLASFPHKFAFISHEKAENFLIVPEATSSRREYIPIGYMDNSVIPSNLVKVIYNPSLAIFSILQSRMHMIWLKTVAGRLGAQYRYSINDCYNTFPFPAIPKTLNEALEQSSLEIIDIREKYSDKGYDELYDPEKMPLDLKSAHQNNDRVVEICYQNNEFESDEERIKMLFKQYSKILNQGKLFI